ncbi:MAG: phosphatidylserine decarboxylase [Gemmatimonadetes bacterium]|nr:phosphatidylserine decarboxylase [Gemmatimonadota bacterium]
MNDRNPLSYYDRETGAIRDEEIYADVFLDWCYNSRSGRFLTDVLFRRRWISRVYGASQRTRWSRRRIGPFVRRLNVDVDEIVRPLSEFRDFSEFFVREIDLSHRTIRLEPDVCISPADGRALAYTRLESDRTFRIKRSSFNLRQMLGDDALAGRYEGGSLFITRLYLSDYHHFHFPDSGTPGPARAISGGYHAVSPYARRSLVPFFTENFRMVSQFDSISFGLITFVEIGAFTVGSIRQCYEAGQSVERATRKGFFELGGSTVAMLFEPGRIRFDDDLTTHTRNGIETYVKLGDSIGRRPGGDV